MDLNGLEWNGLEWNKNGLEMIVNGKKMKWIGMGWNGMGWDGNENRNGINLILNLMQVMLWYLFYSNYRMEIEHSNQIDGMWWNEMAWNGMAWNGSYLTLY